MPNRPRLRAVCVISIRLKELHTGVTETIHIVMHYLMCRCGQRPSRMQDPRRRGAQLQSLRFSRTPEGSAAAVDLQPIQSSSWHHTQKLETDHYKEGKLRQTQSHNPATFEV